MALILLVEDDLDTIDIYRTILSVRGHDTIAAMDGATGLRLALERPVDLVLLDLALPGLDGWSVLERLRSQPPGASPPVLVVTALHERATRAAFAGPPELDVLVKPVPPRRLLEAVEGCLRRSARPRVLRPLAARVDRSGARPSSRYGLSQ